MRAVRGWKIERKPGAQVSSKHRIAAVAFGVVGSVIFGVLVSGADLVVFEDLWLSSFGTPRGLEDVATLSVPLILTGLAAAIPLRLGLWNIGAEGQLFMGAWAGAGMAFLFPDLGTGLLIPLMLLASLVGGALWILLPAIARVRFNVNEIITTLLLNFVAIYWVLYWAGKPWRDPTSVGGVKSETLPEQTEIPLLVFGDTEIPAGFLGALGIAVLVWLIMRQTTLGYQLTMLGASPSSARFAGIPTRRLLVYALLAGGAMAGLAGALEMMGNTHRFGSAVSNNTGYTGIVIAVLAGGSAPGVVVISIVFALIAIIGGIFRAADTSADIIFAMYGLTLILAAMGQGLAHFRLRRVLTSAGADDERNGQARPSSSGPLEETRVV
jgi:general nucleoside transport system permease protein